MTDASLLTQIVAIAADGIAIIMCISPVMQLINLCKTKNINQVSELTFIVLTMNSALWFANFYRNPNFMAIFPHYFGMPLNLTFFSIFAIWKYRALVSSMLVAASWGFVTGFLIILIAVVPKTDQWDSVIAFSAMIVNIAIAFSPMQKLSYVFKTGDYAVLPLCMNTVVMLSSFIWGFYAILINNIPLLVPQIAIIAICLITMGVYYAFKLKGGKVSKTEDKSASPSAADSGKKALGESEPSSAVGVIGAVRKQSIANEAGKGNLVIEIEGRN